VRSVKKGTLQTMLIAGGFYVLLTLVALSAASMTDVAKAPQDGWFILLYDRGGVWLLGMALVIVLAASMGWIDGCVQVCGAQIANDIAPWEQAKLRLLNGAHSTLATQAGAAIGAQCVAGANSGYRVRVVARTIG